MGNILSFSTSKVDVRSINEIESDVVTLLVKLREEELKMDQYVHQQIGEALELYSKRIEKEAKKGYMMQKTIKLNDLIGLAKCELEKKPIQDVTNKPVIDPYKAKEELFQIQKLMEMENSNRRMDYKKCLQEVTVNAKNLSNSFLRISKEEKNRISILFLKLFLKTPSEKISDVLLKTVNYLNKANENLGNFDIQCVTAFNAEEVKINLDEIKRISENIGESSSKCITSLEKVFKLSTDSAGTQNSENSKSYSATVQHSDFRSKSMMYFNTLQEIKNRFNKYEEILKHFCAPISDDSVNKIEEQVNNLQDRLKNVPDNTLTRNEKPDVVNKGVQLLKKLRSLAAENKDISQKLNILKSIERQLTEQVEKSLSFQEKMKSFCMATEEVERINSENNAITIQKCAIFNIIEALKIAESLSYLRELKDKIDHYDKYSRQFAFPISINFYETKVNEIVSLKNKIDNVPLENQFIKDRKLMLKLQIDSTLKILSERAIYNNDILTILADLEHIGQEVLRLKEAQAPEQDKLKLFNNIRQKIAYIVNFHSRILSKKMEILGQLHIVEENIFSITYEELKQMKKLLNQYEENAVQFVHPIASEEYQDNQNKLKILFKKFNTFFYKHDLNLVIMHTFKTNFSFVSELLKQTAAENERVRNQINDLKSIKNSAVDVCKKDLPISKKMQLYDMYQQKIEKIKILSTNKNVQTTLEDTEAIIAVERFKTEFVNLKKHLEAIQEELQNVSRPIDKILFKKNVEKIFRLKEYVDDMPEGNSELDSEKQNLLQQIINVLKTLDEHVATVANRKHPKQVLKLENYFKDFGLDAGSVKKDSMEFVRILRQHAEDFEVQIKHYLGGNDSVDYYVMHENLMRMLEELDRMSSDGPSLLNAITETIVYVQNLVDELESNASSQE